MIVVDALALLAIYLREPERDRFIQALRMSGQCQMSPVNLWETLVRAAALDGAAGAAEIGQLVANFGIAITPIDADTARFAANAFARYGKRTPAGLNLGDCFAYALAKQRNAPLLYKGDDFTKTDVEAV